MKNKPPEDTEYCDRTREQWIKWAEREIEEYKQFIKFLKHGPKTSTKNN